MITKSGKRQEVIDILLEAGKQFNDNSSCLLYLVSGDKNDPSVIWVQDIWSNQADHQAAMQTAQMAKYIKQSMPLLAGMPEQFHVEISGGKASFLQN